MSMMNDNETVISFCEKLPSTQYIHDCDDSHQQIFRARYDIKISECIATKDLMPTVITGTD